VPAEGDRHGKGEDDEDRHDEPDAQASHTGGSGSYWM
jgi:hypothetical protein